jgi:hypothetical protein
MRPRLFADKTKLSHQATHLESTNELTFIAHHPRNAAAARSTSALIEKLIHSAT